MSTLRDLWYHNTILYSLDVETYCDGNGDGIGDFIGLTQRLPYLASLGVTCLWLLPFNVTGNDDDGYDITDYTAVDPRLGTMADFAEFMVQARALGLRVIMDLVPNHTSIDHPWFQAARRDPASPYRDYYVWRTTDPGDTSDQVVFPGEQSGIWTYDDAAGAWYLHHFHDFQPDLNFANPAVREEFRKVMGLWLQLGVSGFRIDAAPFLINILGDDGRSMRMSHEFLRELRTFATLRSGEAILLGEADVPLSTVADYFGGGLELQTIFNFPLNRFLFLGLAEESADPIMFGLQQLPTIPENGQWVNFLRHHDELNLAQLMTDQRERIAAVFGDGGDGLIYGRGLRQRLATLLGGDQQRIRLAYSLLFSLPGAPMIHYGEEIGMGENLDLEGRLSMRAPMAWTSGANGGFSNAEPDALARQPLAEGPYGYREVNVDAQRGDPDSLLSWMTRLISVRQECDLIGHRAWEIVTTNRLSVLAILYTDGTEALLALHNLSGETQQVRLDWKRPVPSAAIDLLRDHPYAGFDAAKPTMRMRAYGYRWIRLRYDEA
jgi:maltose alpha-D-glucosyltransferase/alpha-amylase